MRGLVTACSAVRLSLPLLLSLSHPNPLTLALQAHLPPREQDAAGASALLDPTRDEARDSTAFVSLACMPALGTVTSVRLNGALEPGVLADVRCGRPNLSSLVSDEGTDGALLRCRLCPRRTRCARCCMGWRSRRCWTAHEEARAVASSIVRFTSGTMQNDARGYDCKEKTKKATRVPHPRPACCLRPTRENPS